MFCPSRFLLASVVSASLILLEPGHCPLANADDAANAAADRQRMTNLKPKVWPVRSNETDTSTDSGEDWPWEHVFEDTARFAWVAFDTGGTPIERDALVIYEGMTVRMNRDGSYEVRLRVEAPLTQITLRLELKVWRNKTLEGTITLPPIRIAPERSDDPDSTSQSFMVACPGTSEVLKRLGRQSLMPVEEAMIDTSNASLKAADARRKGISEEITKVKMNHDQGQEELNRANATLCENAVRFVEKDIAKKKNSGKVPVEKDKPDEPKAADVEAAWSTAKAAVTVAETKQKIAADQEKAWKVELVRAESDYAKAEQAVNEAIKVRDEQKLRSLNDVGITFSRGGSARFGGVPR